MGDDMEVTVEVFNQEQYDGEWIPPTLVAAIAWLQEKLEQIPPEFRANARIEVEGVSSYDSSYANILIDYMRPATESEIQEKQNKDAERKRQIEEREQAELERLQSKYKKA